MLKSRIHFAFILLLSTLLLPKAALAYGGTILISKLNNQHYLLLVKTHKSHRFTFPGGRREKASSLMQTQKKRELYYETAIRETVEETRGFLGRQQLTAASSATNKVISGKHHLYLVKLPFFDLDAIRKIKIPNKKKWAPMLEVIDYAWVEVNSIHQNPSKQVTAKDGARIEVSKTVKKAIKAGIEKQWF